MSSSLPFGKRFRDDGVAVVPLNEWQLKARLRLQSKITNGSYHFQDLSCLCGSSTRDAIRLSEKDRHGIPIQAWFCKRCTLIYVSPYLDDASTLTFYAEDYRDLYEGLEQPTDSFFDKQYRAGMDIAAFLQEKIPSWEGRSVLEIGCGAGGILKVFQEKGCRCSGCDLDPRYVRYGQSKGLDLILKDFESIGEIGKRFDLIIISHVLEHLKNPRQTLQAIRSLLHPEGSLYVEVPNVVPGNALMGQLQNAHVWYFNLDSLSRLLEDSGFRVIHHQAPHHLQTLSVLDLQAASRPKSFPAFWPHWLAWWTMERLRSIKHVAGNALQTFGLKETIRSLWPRKQ